MTFVYLLAALVYLGLFIVNGSHSTLQNVAYSKPVTLSSNFGYPKQNAVNGNLNDFAHTDKETSPWLRIDLENHYRIHRVEVIARTDCCTRLHDIKVTVGRTTKRMKTCGYFNGAVHRKGQIVSVQCAYTLVGRYVQIQIVKGSNNYLTPSEVRVYGERLQYNYCSNRNRY